MSNCIFVSALIVDLSMASICVCPSIRLSIQQTSSIWLWQVFVHNIGVAIAVAIGIGIARVTEIKYFLPLCGLKYAKLNPLNKRNEFL